MALAAGLQVLALGSFLALVYPVNLRLPLHRGVVPADWPQLRLRWEFGHAIGFVLFGAALTLLLVDAVRRTPAPARSAS